jgi:hypothetical protein
MSVSADIERIGVGLFDPVDRILTKWPKIEKAADKRYPVEWLNKYTL